MTKILDDNNHKDLIPHFSINNNNIAQVISLLEENNIYYEIEKINPSNTSLGLIPLSKNQLNNTISIFHIYKDEASRVDEIMSNFSPIPENNLEEEIKQQDPTPKITAGSFIGYFFLFIVIFLILFIVVFALNFRGY